MIQLQSLRDKGEKYHVKTLGEQGADGINVGGYVTPIAEPTMRLTAS